MKKILIDTNSFTIKWLSNWLWSSDAQIWYPDPDAQNYIYEAKRILQVVDSESEIFEVHPSLVWLDCNDDLTMTNISLYYYKDGIYLIPQDVSMPTEPPKI